MSTAPDPAALSEAKRAVLERLLRGDADDAPAPSFPHRPAGSAVPLSAGQRRLWLLHRLAPESSAYTMFDARRLTGDVDADAARAALARVVRTHEILRTRYVERDGRPEALIADEPRFDFELVRVSGETSDARERQARALATAFVRRPFDLAAGPVVRAALITVGDGDRILVLAIHHIACDEWSLGIIWRELAAAYAAYRAGRQPDPSAARLQYADFAHWQAGRGATIDTHVEYWRRILAGAPPPLELPPDRLPPASRSFAGGTVSAQLDTQVAERLASIARAAGTTRFVLSLAALLVLLHRYTGEHDLVVGVPATSRRDPALDDVVGFFLNTLALRIDVAGDPTFRALLHRVHAAFLDGVTHADAPFEAVVDAIAPERRLSRNPLFSVMLVEQTPPPAVSFGGAHATARYGLDGGGSKFDLTLFVGDGGSGPGVMIEYDAERFECATAERMLEQYRTLLAAIADEPDRSISTLSLAADAERRLIGSWSRGPTLPAPPLVPERFAEHARATPDSIATVDAAGVLSYGELLRRSDAIAASLLAHGLRRGDRVGLCADRSADMIAGILGILRAGGAYVPLDPDYPPARLEFALRDAGVRIVLSAPGHAAALPVGDRTVLPLHHSAADDVAGRALDLPRPSPDDPAYVLHTSGSTGAPKGVLVTHGNLAHSTAARDVTYPEPPGVFLLLPSFAFDSSVAGIFWTLATGGTLALPPKRIEQDVHALAAFVQRHGVTHTLCLPSLWETILEHAPIAPLRTLRTVIVAGEACSVRLVRRHGAALPGVVLWNEYGPTEATVWCTAYRVPPGFDAARVPIGRPIAGARVHVLGANAQPAPVGVPGELWVGGPGLASYLDRPAESRVRFMADPFSADPGARLYRTGDVARWREDGLLEFLGRTDQQVKVRGHRIEPAEIESALRQHVAVRDVAVGVRSPARTDGDAQAVERIVAALRELGPAEAERLLALAGAAPLEASA